MWGLYPYNKDYGKHGDHCIIDVCSFLDSILNESFLQLETHVTFPGCEPDPALFSIISQQSPNLEELKLDLMHCEATWMGTVETLFRSLSSLEHLTHLTLSFRYNYELRQTVMSLLGKSCPPSLTHLSIIGGCPDGNQEILSLILGETLSNFFPNGYCDAVNQLDHLKVPAKCLTPICSTLRVWAYNECCEYPTTMEISDSTVAFALRHLPFLEYFGSYNAVETSLGIKKLYEIKAEAMEEPVTCERVLLNGQKTNISGRPTKYIYYLYKMTI